MIDIFGAFAVLFSLGGVIISVIALIVFFFMAWNISKIAQKVRGSSQSQDELNLKLDRIIKLLEQEAKGRSND